MSETLTKLDNLGKKCSNCLTWAFTQVLCIGIENKRSFVEIKVPVTLKFDSNSLFQVNVGTHIRCSGQYTSHQLLEIYSGVTVPMIREIS